jgi:Protein of unknown function (DUF4239)
MTAVAVLVAVACMILVRRKIDYAKGQLHHDVADPLMSVVGTLFAVLLGFMIANAMTRFEEVRGTVQHEASIIANIYRTSMGLPSPVREKLQKSCEGYVEAVIDEWPLLKDSKTSKAAWTTYGEIWSTIINLDAQNNRTNNLQQALVGFAGELGDCRRIRVGAEHNGLPLVLWIVLIAGGLATVAFTYFFVVEDLKLQVLMTSLVTIAICLNLFLLASYDDPFSGDVMVKPTPFEYDRKTFQMISHPGSGFPD